MTTSSTLRPQHPNGKARELVRAVDALGPTPAPGAIGRVLRQLEIEGFDDTCWAISILLANRDQVGAQLAEQQRVANLSNERHAKNRATRTQGLEMVAQLRQQGNTRTKAIEMTATALNCANSTVEGWLKPSRAPKHADAAQGAPVAQPQHPAPQAPVASSGAATGYSRRPAFTPFVPTDPRRSLRELFPPAGRRR